MARMIDGDKLVENLRLIATCWSISPFVSKEKHNGAVDMLREVEREVKEAPTLTPPTPAPPCYQPDGDGCGYQCYDGDDEPIDKCKECPLCYSDKQRHHTPPNEPLTLEQLREMDGEPVYIVFSPDVDGEKLQFWALVAVDEWDDVYLANKDEWAFNYEEFLEDVEAIYRRPPEGEEDA